MIPSVTAGGHGLATVIYNDGEQSPPTGAVECRNNISNHRSELAPTAHTDEVVRAPSGIALLP